MAFREELQKKIEKRRVEIADMESRLAQAKSYLQALEDTLRMAPKEPDTVAARPNTVLRHGTDLARTQEAIQKAGKPLHISDLMTALGKEDTKANRVSLAGSLGAYVRQHKIFRKAGPNIFGLIENQSDSATELEADFRLRAVS